MRAVAYCRFSSDTQREESIDAQVREITKYCETNGLLLTHIYADRAESGTTDDRENFQRMMQDAKRKLFEVVLIHKYNRFARNRIDSAINKKILRDHNVQLISVTQPLNDNPESVLLESLLEGIDEYYSLNLGLEAMKGLKENAYQCKHTGGRPPLGFDLDENKKYIINEHEAEAVRLIFKMYSEDFSYGEVMTALEDRGYKGKSGASIPKNSLYDILNNEKYIGYFVFNKSVKRSRGGVRNHRNTKPEEEIIRIEGGVPAIINKETWDAAQARLKDRKRPGQLYTKRVYPLSGLLTCGYCGAAMRGMYSSTGLDKNYSYYLCGRRSSHGLASCMMRRRSATVLERQLMGYISKSFFDPEGLEEMIKVAESHLEDKSVDREELVLGKTLRDIKAKIKNMTAAIENGMFHESMLNRMSELEKDNARIEKRLSDIAIEKIENSFERDRIRLIASELSKKEMSPENQKMIFQALLRNVTVYNDRIEIKSLLG